MSFTPGVFTPTVIGAANLKESELLGTSRMTELSQEIIVGQALLLHQDPTIVTIGFGEPCMNAKVYTMRSGSLDTGATTVACAIGSTVEAGTEAITLTKTRLANVFEFFIKDTQCANEADYGSQKAYLGLKAKVGLEVALSRALLTKVNTGVDTAVPADFETPGALNGAVYEITEANWSSDVLADLQWAASRMDMNAPIIINGRNFFNKAVLDQYASAGCCSNDSILNTNSVFDVYWDKKNVVPVIGADASIVVDKNAAIFWSSPAYSNMGMETAETEGKESADRFHWVETLPRLQYFANGQMNPIYVDVRAERTCILDALQVPRDGWSFQYILHGANVLNLTNQDDLQGVLKIKKIA
jgi:hypothetical protein